MEQEVLFRKFNELMDGEFSLRESGRAISAGFITLSNGRRAEVQIHVTTDEDDFIAEEEDDFIDEDE